MLSWDSRVPGFISRGLESLYHVITGDGNASTSHSIVTGSFSTTVMFSTLSPPMLGGTGEYNKIEVQYYNKKKHQAFFK